MYAVLGRLHQYASSFNSLVTSIFNRFLTDCVSGNARRTASSAIFRITIFYDCFRPVTYRAFVRLHAWLGGHKLFSAFQAEADRIFTVRMPSNHKNISTLAKIAITYFCFHNFLSRRVRPTVCVSRVLPLRTLIVYGAGGQHVGCTLC